MNPPCQPAANNIRSRVVVLREIKVHGISNSTEKQCKYEQGIPQSKLHATSSAPLWDYPIDADQNRLEICVWERGTTMKQVYLMIFNINPISPAIPRQKEVKKKDSLIYLQATAPAICSLDFQSSEWGLQMVTLTICHQSSPIWLQQQGYSTKLLIL